MTQYAFRLLEQALDHARATGDGTAYDLVERALLILTRGESFFEDNREQLIKGIDLP